MVNIDDLLDSFEDLFGFPNHCNVYENHGAKENIRFVLQYSLDLSKHITNSFDAYSETNLINNLDNLFCSEISSILDFDSLKKNPDFQFRYVAIDSADLKTKSVMLFFSFKDISNPKVQDMISYITSKEIKGNYQVNRFKSKSLSDKIQIDLPIDQDLIDLFFERFNPIKENKITYLS